MVYPSNSMRWILGRGLLSSVKGIENLKGIYPMPWRGYVKKGFMKRGGGR